MRIAVMQPYFFAYPGYFELIAAVDKFIVYDDVDFIKNGWINRNRIAVNGKPAYFTVPIAHQSSNRLIAETMIHERLFESWKRKFLLTLQMQYSKAPFYREVYGLVNEVLGLSTSSIADLSIKSILAVAEYVGLETSMCSSIGRYGNTALNGEARLLDICIKENAAEYVNNAGGRFLYDPCNFQDKGITLHFLLSRMLEYQQQKTGSFIPNLSILDAMMYMGSEEIREWLLQYQLETPMEKPVLK